MIPVLFAVLALFLGILALAGAKLFGLEASDLLALGLILLAIAVILVPAASGIAWPWKRNP